MIPTSRKHNSNKPRRYSGGSVPPIQLNSNRYVLGQLTAPTRKSLTSDRARAVAVVRAPGSPLSPLQGGPGCVPRWGACARGMAQARALRPARLLTHQRTTRATTLTYRTTDQGWSVVESGHGLGSKWLDGHIRWRPTAADPRLAERSVTTVSRSTLTRPALAPPPPGNTGDRLRSRWVNRRLQTCAHAHQGMG